LSATFAAPAAHTELPLLICFVDLSRFAVNSERVSDRDLAILMDEFYTRVCAKVVGAGGAAVKFMGDAALVVFPESQVNDGVLALLELQEECRPWLAGKGWDGQLVVKAHFGSAVAGPFGPREYGRHDVIGSAVNLAATLPARSFALSAQAFRKLSPEMRRRFMKHTPPVTYIPVGSQAGHGPEPNAEDKIR
jgi:class 3 adenylate cyclase